MTLAAGDRFPEFSLPGNGGRTLSSASLAGKHWVIYFYPKADTSGCTRQAQEFQALLQPIVAVVGVSKDPVAALDKFAAKYGLSFPLLSDQDGDLCERAGTWVQKSMYGRSYLGIERSSFLIDAGGVIRQVWRKVSVAGHAEAVRQALDGR